MVINNSKVAQLFYYQGETLEVLPRFAVYPKIIQETKDMVRVKNIEDRIGEAKRIVLLRTFGLGDVLQLLPVVKELKQKYTGLEVCIATAQVGFRGELISTLAPGLVDSVMDTSGLWRAEYDLGIFLDYYLELDHTFKDFFGIHRVDLYRMLLGLPTGEQPEWSDELERGGGGYVVVHGGGNWAVKAFPDETFKYIVAGLAEELDVVELGKNERLSVVDYIDLLLDAQCVITFDTATFWLAHFTRTPTVVILGPTEDKARLVYHPLYPDGVAAVRVDKLVGCEPCHERREKCEGKISCMKADKGQVFDKVVEAINKVMWKEE